MSSLLRFESICKSFHGVSVLKNITFEAKGGEVLAMVGENGAGKSTLLKILSGDYQPTSGCYYIDEKKTSFNTPNDAIEAGIGLIYQERQIVPDLSVAENIFMGRLPKKWGFVDFKALEQKTQLLLDEFGVSIKPTDKIRRLSVAMQQMVEIIKVYSRKPKVIAFDEPTTALTKKESEVLFDIIEKLKQQDMIIIYVSHRMDEIFRISDRIVILKDGELVEVVNSADTREEEVVNKMVGRPMKTVFNDLISEKPSEEIVLQARNYSGNGFSDVSFELRRGEILGFFGLVGSGRTELMRGIFGVDPITSGTLTVRGKEMKLRSPIQAVKNGIGFLTEDRKDQGIFPIQSVRENISISVLDRFKKLGLISARSENEFARNACERFSVKTSSIHSKISELSGGNQQKALIARWLSMDPSILILDEPTKGIDIGAKFEIYKLIKDIASRGISVILITSELPEVIGLSSRIYVMKGGKIVAQVAKEEATEENIIAYAMLTNTGKDKQQGATI